MTEQSKAVVPVSHELAALGRRPEVKELARRIQTQAPAGMTLSPKECLTLAQYSFSLGANPLIGETWLLKSGDKVLGVMPGIRLYRRRADEADERRDDVRWQEPEVVADSDERERLGVPQDARICIVVRLYRRSQAQAYSALAESLSKAGAPWGDIKQIAGTKPYITGVGYVTATERTKMPEYQCALKRAETHALKQAYSLPFGFIALAEGAESEVPDGAVLEDYVLEAQWHEVAAEPDERTPEQRHESAVSGAAALYGEAFSTPVNPSTPAESGVSASSVRSWSDATVERVSKLYIEQGVVPPDSVRKHVIQLMNLSPFDDAAPESAWLPWGRLYRSKRDEGLKPAAAAQYATQNFSTPF